MGLVSFLGLVAYVALQAVFLVRAVLRPHRDPASRTAWVLIMLAIPALGMFAYLLFGETNIGRKQAERYRWAAAFVRSMPGSAAPHEGGRAPRPEFAHLFRLATSINDFRPVAGNQARILNGGNAAIDAIVSDIDRAERSVHLIFYIWLADRNGLRVVEALKRAAARGVAVRAMADDIGSRRLIRSSHWASMRAAGVHLARALPVSNPVLHPIRGRLDLRNHRKLVVIDDRVTYCGSMNCADPEFRVKPRYAPWVDLALRLEGPVALQNQDLFLLDWISQTDEDPMTLVPGTPDFPPGDACLAQAVGTGPTVRASAMPEMFEVLIHAARRELTITTPYFVPSDSMQDALVAAGHRGVDTRLILPKRNDSRIVAAASRSYYWDLVQAGVRIFEFRDGLLHAKTLTLDGEVALVGSANLDRRSFDLNYENNVLVEDRDLTAALCACQKNYIDRSDEVLAADIRDWGIGRRLWNNTVSMLGPVL